jgi:electron transfer flavoprotein alpha subunit
MAQIFAYIRHKDGVIDDSALELVNAAKKIDPGAAATAVVTGSGAELETVCNQVAASYSQVWKVDHAALAYPNAELVRKALLKLLPADGILLVAHDTLGMDLSPGLAVKMNLPFVSDVVAMDSLDGTVLKLVRQEYGGMAHTHVACETAAGAVINTRAGAFAPDETRAAAGQVVDKSGAVGDLAATRAFLEVVAAEAGDVDITKSDVLVSIGRGIEDQENIELAEELAQAMGAVVSCSRPIVDAKWLEKARQVGTSGQTVKPKVYMALGISGSFQHLGGIKGNPFMIAVNKNPKAPIFQVADVGIVADILEFMPELTEKIAR